MTILHLLSTCCVKNLIWLIVRTLPSAHSTPKERSSGCSNLLGRPSVYVPDNPHKMTWESDWSGFAGFSEDTFSSIRVQQNHQEGFVKCRCWMHPRRFWFHRCGTPRMCISSRVPKMLCRSPRDHTATTPVPGDGSIQASSLPDTFYPAFQFASFLPRPPPTFIPLWSTSQGNWESFFRALEAFPARSICTCSS